MVPASRAIAVGVVREAAAQRDTLKKDETKKDGKRMTPDDEMTMEKEQ